MKSVVIAAAAALALSCGAALAAGNGASANSTTTSMGAPAGSPEYSAPRSEVVPGVPHQERRAEERNEGTTHYSTPVPSGADGHVQVTR
jgi:curli biogenesis system outer membrane secretion channel CsgG